MNHQPNLSSATQAKKLTIMEAMTVLVYQYGYAKITMDDIAKESGLSRPALYQFFKNKQEIYRAIAEHMSNTKLAKMREVLDGDLPPLERLVQAVIEGKLRMFAEMEATKHGAELLDLGNTLSADVIERYISEFTQNIVSFFAEVTPKNSNYSAEMTGKNLVYWLEGMIHQKMDPVERETLLREFVAMQFAAIGLE